MKRFIYTLFLLLTFTIAKSQLPSYLPLGSPIGNSLQRVKVLKTFHIPYGISPTLNEGLPSPGALYYNTSDSIVYVYTGTEWIPSSNVTNVVNDYTVIGGGTIVSLPDIPALISYVRDTISTVVVQDSDRGGIFIWKDHGFLDYGTVFPAEDGGYWHRIFDQAGALNLRWYGALGTGTSSVDEDTAAIHHAYDFYLNRKGGRLYVPNPPAFYSFAGIPQKVGDNIEMFGDGFNKSEIRVVAPDNGAAYPGAAWMFSTYGSNSTLSPFQSGVKKYEIYPTAINDTVIRLVDASKLSELYEGEIVSYGCLQINKNNDPNKPRMTFWESNEIDRLTNDSVVFKFPIRIDIVDDVDGTHGLLFNMNNDAGTNIQFNIPNFSSKNIEFHDMVLSQSQYDELADTALTERLAGVWQPGGAFNSRFHDMTIIGYSGIGGNNWTRCKWWNLKVKSERKLTDVGWGSSNLEWHDIDYEWMESPASNFASGFFIVNDNAHDLSAYNIKASGEFKGSNIFTIAGVRNFNLDKIDINFPHYFYDNNVITITEDAINYARDIHINNINAILGGVGNFIYYNGDNPDVLGRNVSITNSRFIGTLVGYGASEYQFTASGLTTPPIRGDIYTNNGSTFQMRDSKSVQIAEGVYTMTFIRTAGTNAPTSTGTLTKTFGGGDATITFSDVTDVAVSEPNAINIKSADGFILSGLVFSSGKLRFTKVDNSEVSGVIGNDSLLISNCTNTNFAVTAPYSNTHNLGKALSIVSGKGYINGGEVKDIIETSTVSSSTPRPTGYARDNYFDVTALATAATILSPSGTAVNHNILTVRIKDDGTARAISWNVAYKASVEVALPTTTTVNKTLYVTFIYNSASAKWDLTSVKNN